MNRRRLIIASIAGLALIAVGFWLLAPPAVLYRVTHSERHFNMTIKAGLPKGADVTQLESLVGRGEKIAPPDWMLPWIAEKPERNPDGWRDSDQIIRYPFARSTWYFQVRDGHLVNYDPADVVIDPPPLTSLAAPPKKS
jgi:hypothetical protein